jgi:hypothetical protein
MARPKRYEAYRVTVEFIVEMANPQKQDARDAWKAVERWLLVQPDRYKVGPIKRRG